MSLYIIYTYLLKWHVFYSSVCLSPYVSLVTHNRYDASRSLTHIYNGTGFSIQYASGNVRGFLSEDVVVVSNKKPLVLEWKTLGMLRNEFKRNFFTNTWKRVFSDRGKIFLASRLLQKVKHSETSMDKQVQMFVHPILPAISQNTDWFLKQIDCNMEDQKCYCTQYLIELFDLWPLTSLGGWCWKLCSSKVENSEEKTRRLRIRSSAEFLYSMTCVVICSHRRSQS